MRQLRPRLIELSHRVTAMRPRTKRAAAALLGAAVLVGAGSALAFAGHGPGGGAAAAAVRADDRASRDEVRATATAPATSAPAPTTGAPTQAPPPPAPPTTTTRKPTAPAPVVPGPGCSGYTGNRLVACNLLPSFGFSTGQMAALDPLWQHESGWSTTAANSSGAYGIPQALPGSKMSTVGADWRTSAATQISWGLSYIKSRYGSPSAAWSYWQSHHWY